MHARTEYENRLALRGQSVKHLEAHEARIANYRLAVFFAGAIVVFIAYRLPQVGYFWVLIPLAGFIALVIQHERVLQRLRAARGALRFYQAGLARLNHVWQGQGVRGDQLFPNDHPYAADLDLYGEGSLFELLCTARTRAGEQRLADWLAGASDPETIRARQAAVAELRPRLDLREALALLGDETRSKIHPADLTAWGNLPETLPKRWLRPISLVLGVFGAVSLLILFTGNGPVPFFVALLVEGAVYGRWRRSIGRITKEIDQPSRELGVMAQVIARLEQESFQSPLLHRLKLDLQAGTVPASKAIAQLQRIVQWIEAQENQFFALVSFFLMLPFQLAYAVERWRASHGPEISRWLDALGEMEALLALASYAFEHPDDPFPTIVETGPVFDAKQIAHPLIADPVCVRNDLRLDSNTRLFIVSGSNMSGKSTLLRSVGVNAVLAQAGAPVRAESLTMSPLQLGATMRIQDSILLGRSRFYAEIERLGRLAELGYPERPLLFLLDELLHGTNSHDRAIGGEAVLHHLLDRGGIGLMTTHDLALTGIESRFNGHARNVHFRDEVIDGELHFDFKLREGAVKKGNALDLMRAVGLRV